MKLNEIFENSLKFPFSNKKMFIALGGFCLISSMFLGLFALIMAYVIAYSWAFVGLELNLDSASLALIFIIFPLAFFCVILGYQIEVIKTSLAGIKEIPLVNKWKYLIPDGIKTIIVGLVYLFIPIIFYIAGLIPLITITTNGGDPSWDAINWTLINIGFILTIISYSIFLIAKANMAYKGNLMSAFEFKEIIKKIKVFGSVNYLLLIIILFSIESLLIIGFILSLISFIGVLIAGLLILPFLVIFESRIVALVYKETIMDELKK